MRYVHAGSLSLALVFTSMVVPPASAGLPKCICKGTGSLELVVADHLLPHEERPYGIPAHWDWSTGPVTHSGTDPGGFEAMTFWGQVFEGASGNPASNTRVHIRDARTYVLSRCNREWHLLQSDVEVEGGMFEAVTGTQTAADIRAEPEGGISVTAVGSRRFHFWGHWPKSRVPIQPNDIAGVFTTVQARLVLDDPNGPDDRAIANYVVNMGADYWRTVGIEPEMDARCDFAATAMIEQNNCSVGHGRFKRVRSDWRQFTMIAVDDDDSLDGDEAAIRSAPPPLDLILTMPVGFQGCLMRLPCAPVAE